MVERPRKWSTLKTWLSGTRAVSVRFSSRALASSVPKGFSITSMVPAGSMSGVSVEMHAAATEGGSALFVSGIDPGWRERAIFPIISPGALRATLGILARTVARRAAAR